jgi:hypothetical protein
MDLINIKYRPIIGGKDNGINSICNQTGER